MKVEQNLWTRNGHWQADGPTALGTSAQLVFVFGATSALVDEEHFRAIRAAYPQAHVCGCSTAGEINGVRVLDDSLVVTAAQFEDTRLETARIRLDQTAGSLDAGRRLAAALSHAGLVHVFVLSDGLKVNGSELVQGLASHLPANVAVTGGLSGDGARFERTLVTADRPPESGVITVVGFYGQRLRVGYGSVGGWDPFGPERIITRSKGNVLYELDGQSALSLYKKYLGEHAAHLPASGLLFPLSVRTADNGLPVVRTILSVDEQAQSLTFAGDVPQGAHGRLMKANFDRLIDGATQAAQSCVKAAGADSADLAVLISCVGRKLVLKQRVEEEVESVRDVLGPKATLAGFYSYGEISPFAPSAKCELHNQTMTITTFAER
jgi:hypothetical protein